MGFQQVVVYHGLAALPLHFWFGRFKKSFFLHPTTFELYGRVGVRTLLHANAAAPCSSCVASVCRLTHVHVASQVINHGIACVLDKAWLA